jgi:PAS domain S-box-containing protein
MVFAVSLTAIGGWFSDLREISVLVNSIADMRFNTSICLIFSAISLYAYNRTRANAFLKKAGLISTYLLLVFSALTLVEYITEYAVSIRLIRRIDERIDPASIEVFASFLFLMISFIFLSLRRSKQHVVTQILLPLVFFVSVFITFNYISGLSYLDTIPFAIHTALTTSLSIMLLCIGIFFSAPLRDLKFSFERKIAGYFAVAILVLGIVFFSFIANNLHSIESNKLLDHTKDVLFTTAKLLNQGQDIESATRGYLITGKDEFLVPFYESSVLIYHTISDIRKLTLNQPGQHIRVDSLLSITRQNIELREKIIELKRAGIVEPALAIVGVGAERQLMDRLRAVIHDIQSSETALLNERKTESEKSISSSLRMITILEILVLLILIIVFLIIYKNTRSRNHAEAELRKSERFSRSIIDNAASSISIKDVAGNYLLINKTAQKLMRVTEQEVLGKSPYDFFPKEVADETRALDEEVIVGRKSMERSIAIPEEDGYRHYIVVRFPLFDENDEVYAVCSMSTDITEIKRAQTMMEQAHKEQQLILNGIERLMDASLDIICVLDETGRFKQMSANTKRLLGYDPDELIGKHYTDFIVNEEKRPSMILEEEILSGKTISDFENRYIKKDGTTIPLFWTAVWSSESRSFYTIVKDGTEKKMTGEQLTKLNKTLEKRAAELQASNTELERFAYVASHDLQEPLRMVSSFLQLLEKKLDGALDNTGKQYIAFAIDGAERMKILIQDLLQYSRVGTSKELIVDVDLNEILKSVQALYSLAIKEAGAVLIVHPLPVVKAERGQMQQLFQNLIGNALKYTGSNTPVIEIGCEDRLNNWQFFIRDNGIGIAPRFYEKIFVIFQRLHNKSEYSGTGIGLAICKKIVERHEGQIWVESSTGNGSTFFVSLPKH